MRKTRWALIGCGKVVLKNKTTPFINFKNTITGICTTNVENSKKAIKKLKLKKCGAYENVDDMLKNETIDAIYICTPPKFHYLYLKKIYKYNIPVYVEKPFVRTNKEALNLVKLYNNNNVPLFVAHYKRLTPKIQKLKNVIDDKVVGEIMRIEGNFCRIFNIDLLNNSWIYNKEISGGGRFFDIAPHILDVIYYLFGEFYDINSNVIYETELHNCENIVDTTFSVGNIRCALYFNFISNEEVDLIKFYGTNGYIITSINRNKPIEIYNNDNKLIRKISFKKTKTWGIEMVNQINKYIHNGTNSGLCDVNQASLIQSYIELMLKK